MQQRVEKLILSPYAGLDCEHTKATAHMDAVSKRLILG